jgi:hypothetical protein
VQLHLAAIEGDVRRLRRVLDSGKVHVDSKDKVRAAGWKQVSRLQTDATSHTRVKWAVLHSGQLLHCARRTCPGEEYAEPLNT